jgi:hypothetical protein
MCLLTGSDGDKRLFRRSMRKWENTIKMEGHKISGLNPVARSESLAAIFSRTDLILKKRKIYQRLSCHIAN